MGLLDDLDALLLSLFAGSNALTILLTVAVGGFLAFLYYDSPEPDTHPMLLARGASASPVRMPGESAVYRSQELPHGYPLRTGLGVKYPGAPAYSGGKNGDLRDIWRRVSGKLPLEGGDADANTGKILTVLGKEEVVEHDIKELEREIAAVGKFLKGHKAQRVAVYLPNCIELLAVVFAGSFFGFDTILVPYNQPPEALTSLLRETEADSLIAEAGSLPLEDVGKDVPNLHQVVWVVEKTSRHVDWSEVPAGVGGKIDVVVWHELSREQNGSSAELPADDSKQTPGGIVAVWQVAPGAQSEIVEFSQANLTAAIASHLSVLPRPHRLTPSDLFLSAESLTHTYALTLTLAALFSHATVALTSVAGAGVPLAASSVSVAPTVIVASAETAASMHEEEREKLSASTVRRVAHTAQTRVLAGGAMPSPDGMWARVGGGKTGLGTEPGKLRLLYVSERAGMGGHKPPMTAQELSDLRVFTGARVVYALTAAKVTGAAAQTTLFDYRNEGKDKAGKPHVHFGVPPSSLELKVVDARGVQTTDDKAEGEVVAMGPSVAGGEARLGFLGRFRDDGCLAYL
ncbi:hypothetical protein BDY21DRAFT_289228 [Lineolata rhizophorae]|uniref:AMP-dependent synthetase/ligase domain-containing protein n=1 Tax=Lineolata rhizophorae TaxID=578093 RepID=A0A6A6NVV5_9PEZI|nr:hypothetical protein BDY21DRAFT_289228 [Lineolata rhizophorae]